jgi:hypothetical protein
MTQSIEDEGGPLDPAFDDHVLPAELAALRERSSARTRRAGDESGLPDFQAHIADPDALSPFFRDVLARLDDDAQHQCWRAWVRQAPERRHGGMTGLAFSGGGIRSSTLNLGIAQVVHRLGLFKCLDYLSTVSGGGYVGSSISACYATEETPGGDITLHTHEHFPYQHVRGRPEPTAFLQLRNFSCFLAPRGWIDYLRLPVLLLRGLLLNFLVFLPWIVGLALVTGALLVESEQGAWLWRWHGLVPGLGYFASTLWLGGALLALVVVFPMTRKVQIWTEGIGRTRVQRDLYERFMAVVGLVVAASAWVELQPLVIGYFLDRAWSLSQLAAGAGGGSAILALLGRLFARQLRYLLSRFALYVIALAGFVAFWLLYVTLSVWLIQAPGWWEGTVPGLPVAGGYVAVLIVLVPYSVFLIDANGLSLHNFYRDRLARAFLFRVRDGEVENSLDLKFSELSKHLGPLHLFNTTMNTRRFPQQFRKGRHGDPFFLSALYSGSRTTGYCPTAELERVQPDLTVSTAIATSGAAVTSNMGMLTKPVLRAILAVLNVRLGYWLVNPYHYDAAEKRIRWHPGRLLGVGVVRYLQELTGWLDYTRSYVYLSDGGHIENMGIYPLIQRQCRLIIVGDGECDPAYTFQGLLDAVRMIRIDFGVHIEMKGLDAIRSGTQHHALGTIHYPGGRKGYLVYLKSCLLGDHMLEATVPGEAFLSSRLRSDERHYDSLGHIAHYKATHSTFPHESTADQFFDEAQFESYRALGYLIAERAFRGEAEPGPPTVRQTDSMASELEAAGAPES